MALGRPVNKDTQYKVIVHTLGKHRYAATKVFTVGENGKKQYTYKHWGTLDGGNRFHPGTNYFYASVADRNKLIFPSDWDMSEISELSSARRRGRVSYQDDDVDRQYGATWLLDKVAEATGVKDDLLKVLGGNNEMVNDVLTMAALRSMSPKPSRSPGNEAVLPARKWKIRNYRYTKLKNSEYCTEKNSHTEDASRTVGGGFWYRISLPYIGVRPLTFLPFSCRL